MTTLVTGGAGFIGHALCQSLLEDGHNVVCLDNLSSGRRKNIQSLHDEEGFTFVEGDIRTDISQLVSNVGVKPNSFDRVYHLASRASPDDFEQHPLDIAETNTTGTRKVLEFSRLTDSRVLFSSTSEVYGDPKEHPQKESYNGNVDPRGPRACYDESKRFGETLVNIFTSQYGLDTRTARLFNTYGPRMRPDDGRVIPNFISQAFADEPLTVYGDGTQTRSFVYITDLIQGLRLFMEAPNLKGDVINLGSTEEVTIQKLAELIINMLNTDSEITYRSLPHENDPSQRRPDISRAEERLDWEPTISLKQGIRRTARHFQQQETI